MNAATFLRLGRVSNLPTVWSNTLAGAALAGAWPLDARIVPLLLAMTLAYTGGMFLNDAFDREIDARERPERPIPSGDAGVFAVFLWGGVMLGTSVLLVALCALGGNGGGVRGVLLALALVAAIVGYDLWHKDNPSSPVLMGLCRVLVYLTVAHALVATPVRDVHVGGAILLCYLIGLTCTAKREHLGRAGNLWPLALLAVPLAYGVGTALQGEGGAWLPTLLLAGVLLVAMRLVRRRAAGDVPRAVALMIAGIALVDAIFLATSVDLGSALFAIAAFALTLMLQRHIAGT